MFYMRTSRQFLAVVAVLAALFASTIAVPKKYQPEVNSSDVEVGDINSLQETASDTREVAPRFGIQTNTISVKTVLTPVALGQRAWPICWLAWTLLWRGTTWTRAPVCSGQCARPCAAPTHGFAKATPAPSRAQCTRWLRLTSSE